MFNHDSWCPACEIIVIFHSDGAARAAVDRIRCLLNIGVWSGGEGPVVRLRIKWICGVHCSHWTCDPIGDSDGSSESLNDSIIEM